jgi:hypothetical protein
MRSIAIAMCFVAAAGDASAFSRCRLSAEECYIVANERYRLAAISDYERSLPSIRTRYEQGRYLIERDAARFRKVIAGKPRRIAAEMVRLFRCDTIAELDVIGVEPSIREDCR